MTSSYNADGDSDFQDIFIVGKDAVSKMELSTPVVVHIFAQMQNFQLIH